MSDKVKRAHKCCEVCGAQLIKDYYYTGRCALHQTTKAPDTKLSSVAVAAKCHGLSYGQYMAALREGRV